MTYKLVTLGGDGIGPEVLREGLRVLAALSVPLGLAWEIDDSPCGGQFYLQNKIGLDWPEDAPARCEAADLILLGAVPC